MSGIGQSIGTHYDIAAAVRMICEGGGGCLVRRGWCQEQDKMTRIYQEYTMLTQGDLKYVFVFD